MGGYGLHAELRRLVLLGGRVADYLGRKRVFIVELVELVGFAAASTLGGFAPDSAALFAARALQGAFAALMAPAALYVVRDSSTERSRGHYDVPGALTSTLGLVALVYAFTQAETTGWLSAGTLLLLAGAGLLLGAFVVVELRSQRPLLPLRVVLDRDRGGSYPKSLLVGLALFGMFLFLTYYLQGTLHYSALKTGFAFLPLSLGIVISSAVAAQLLPRVGPRALMVTGMVMATAGLVLFTRLGVHSGYVAEVLPPILVTSLGMGPVFVPLSSTALIGVDESYTGVASALVNTTQQVGGSLGTALLNTVAVTTTASFLQSHAATTASKATAVVHGYGVAFGVSAVLLGVGALAALVLVRANCSDLETSSFAPEAA
jgi:MFS family permease